MVKDWPIISLPTLNIIGLPVHLDNIGLNFEKIFLLSMVSATCGCLHMVQGCVFEPTGSNPSKSPLLFRKEPNKLAGALASPSELLNIPAAAPADPRAPLRVYTNEKV